jgi:transcriptional regulator MraZ
MFSGPSKVTLDAKGRLAIPTRHRERIVSRYDGKLVVTIEKGDCLLLYPLPEWEDLARKLDKLPSLDPESRRLQRMLLGHAVELELDGNGRVLLPREHREYAGLDRSVMLIGQGHRFELWDEQRWSELRTGYLSEGSGNTGLVEELQKFVF